MDTFRHELLQVAQMVQNQETQFPMSRSHFNDVDRLVFVRVGSLSHTPTPIVRTVVITDISQYAVCVLVSDVAV